MGFLRPSLAEIVARSTADLRVGLGGGSPARVSFARVLGTVLGGISYSLHGHLDWVSRQAVPLTAEGHSLDLWAAVWGLRRKPAAFATGNIVVTGNAGATVPLGTVFHVGGIEYEAEASATIPASRSVAVGVVCRVPGPTGNLEPGVRLSLLEPLSGVDVEATTGEGGLRGGSAIEEDAPFRARLLARVQKRPQGGSVADYEGWALEVPGITRAWVFPWWLGPGTVGVCLCSDTNTGPSLPGAPKIEEVQSYLEARKNATAKVVAFVPTLRPLPLRVRLAPDNAPLRARVQEALRATFARLAPGETVYVARLAAALLAVEGVQSATLLEPLMDTTPERAEILTLGEITWTPS